MSEQPRTITVGPLSQYLMEENSALSQQNAIISHRYRLATTQLKLSNRAMIGLRAVIRNRDEQIDRLRAELTNLNERWQTMSEYAVWLERGIRDPGFRRIPSAMIRTLYENEGGDIIYCDPSTGEQFITYDLEHWAPYVDLTTPEQ